MQRKTLTTLNQLRIGDSFVFAGKDEVWRVTARANKSGAVAINKFIGDKQIYKYDELRKGKVQVVFLQHTIPVPGEEILLDNLVAGDVFKKSADDVHEYVVVQRSSDVWFDVRRLDQAAPEKGGKLANVIFIRHNEVRHTTLN